MTFCVFFEKHSLNEKQFNVILPRSVVTATPNRFPAPFLLHVASESCFPGKSCRNNAENRVAKKVGVGVGDWVFFHPLPFLGFSTEKTTFYWIFTPTLFSHHLHHPHTPLHTIPQNIINMANDGEAIARHKRQSSNARTEKWFTDYGILNEA